MNTTEREKVYLAALLHDIGKFYQRADKNTARKSEWLQGKNKKPSSYCPLNPRKCRKKTWYTHKHVLWTAQFIDDFQELFNEMLEAPDTNHSADKTTDNKQLSVGQSTPQLNDSLKDLAAGHHLGKGQITALGNYIKEADCLSSGMDRDGIKDGAFMDERTYFKRKRMVPLFQTIEKDSSFRQWSRLPLVPLELSKAFFPKQTFNASPDYASLWDSFKEEVKKIQSSNYHSISETLLNLLHKYTSCIPASTINFPDVSLYDHLKTTAAISVCLYDFYDFYQQKNEIPDNPFLMIGADFSGIQSYIYQIVSKYAGKNLKGRSFYLSLLSDAVVRYLLKELQLFQANVVFNSGGSFYLLAPNTPETKENLEKAIQAIDEKLFKAHGTSLFLAIDSVAVSREVLRHENGKHLGQVWGELYEKCEKKKSAKYASQINSNYQLFEPYLQGGNAQRDSITGEEFLSDESTIKKDGLKLKETTAKQIEIGKKLRETKRIVVAEEPIQGLEGKASIIPADIGFTYYFLESDEDLKQLKQSNKIFTIITLNGTEGDCDFMPREDKGNVYSLDFYGGNEFNGATFNEMCENNNFSRLGVLRMDVDDLGKAFREGIAPERATLSRFSTLSRSIDFFFSGYLNTIWKEIDTDRSFIVYCGGDDVFVVGSWDVMIKFAKRIRDDFMEYACGNPAFTLSAGIAIVHPKFPIMKGAEESAIEEEHAKQHVCKVHLKNSISFMDMPLNWEHEFPAVEELKDNLVTWLSNKQVPKSFLSKVMSHYENAEMKNHQIWNIKTYWMLTYDLSRQKSKSHPQPINDMIDNCIKEVCDKNKGTLNGKPIVTDYHPLELWACAARWAELEYRSKDNQ